MIKARRFISAAAAAIVLWVSAVCAQGQIPAGSAPSTIPVTAAATADRVRFTAPSTVVQMRLEVYAANGDKPFDIEVRGGNVIDWRLQDGQAQPLSDGAYLCVVSVKTISGRITQRIASATVERSRATLQSTVASKLTPQQSGAIGPIEDDASLILLKDDENGTATVISHNGEDGQITRGQGALSFRLGDFFRGTDVEQMRLTTEGNLGIGVAAPQAKLDVAGAIRASQGIMFPDGSIQFSAARKTFGTPSSRAGQSGEFAQGDDPRPTIAGSGTTGKISKWLDGPSGVLSDSVITELNGSIGINGAPNPTFKLDVTGHNRFRGSNVSFYLTGTKPTGNEWLFQTVDADGRLRIFDNTSGTEPLSLTQSGDLGLGTISPNARMHVRANLGNVLIGDPGCNPGFGAIGFGTSMTGCSNYSLLGDGSHTYLNRPPGGSILFREGNVTQMSITPGGNVGIGVTNPGAKLDVVANSGHVLLGDAGCNPGFNGIGFGSTLVGCTNYSLMGNGADTIINRPSGGRIDFREANISQVTMTAGGNVGIGTSTPDQKLSVAGTVQSTLGGFMFPDGSVQTAAAPIGTAATKGNNSTDPPIPIVIGGTSVFNHLNVSVGFYLAVATVEVVNSANFLGQNNSRTLICSIQGGEDFSFDVPGLTRSTVSFHSLSNVGSTGISIRCRANVTSSELQITTRRLTVVKLDGSVSHQ